MLSILYPNMTDNRVIVLKTLLNEILKSNPPLVVNNRFDNQLQAAVIKFKSERNLFPCNATIDDATFDFIKQLLPTEKLRQIFNESIRNNSGDVSAISLIWNELIFQSDEQRQTDEIPLDDKIIDDLRGYLVKLMADPTFNRFISALIRICRTKSIQTQIMRALECRQQNSTARSSKTLIASEKPASLFWSPIFRLKPPTTATLFDLTENISNLTAMSS